MANSRAVAATVVGAVIGGIAAYMFFTEHGRAIRRQLEPALDDLARELSHFRTTLNRAANVAGEGWKVLSEALGESETRTGHYSSPHQSSPF